jgi:hypothetical protein
MDTVRALALLILTALPLTQAVAAPAPFPKSTRPPPDMAFADVLRQLRERGYHVGSVTRGTQPNEWVVAGQREIRIEGLKDWQSDVIIRRFTHHVLVTGTNPAAALQAFLTYTEKNPYWSDGY